MPRIFVHVRAPLLGIQRRTGPLVAQEGENARRKQSGAFPGLSGPNLVFRVPYVLNLCFRTLRVGMNLPNQSTSLDSRSVAQPG